MKVSSAYSLRTSKLNSPSDKTTIHSSLPRSFFFKYSKASSAGTNGVFPGSGVNKFDILSIWVTLYHRSVDFSMFFALFATN